MRTDLYFKARFPERLLPIYISSLIFFSLLNGCESKPDLFGNELLPSGDNFTVSFDSAQVIIGHSVPGDSINGSSKLYQLLGSIIDPFFGFSKAEYVTQIEKSFNSTGFGPNPRVDSVILYLEIEKLTGEGMLPQQIRAYEYNEFIIKDTSYFTNMDITGRYRQPEIGNGWMSENDSIVKIYITDNEFINKFLEAEDSILQNTEYIQELMYGIYITADDVTTAGAIASIYGHATGTLLTFYYANDTATSVSQNYNITRTGCQQFNLFHHDYTGYPIEEYLTDTSKNDSLLFVQSMAGVKSIIRFPGFTRWLDSMPVAINEARLILPIADTIATQQKSKYFPSELLLYLIGPNGVYKYVYDNLVHPESFGGQYDENFNSYNFTIKVHLQSIAQGDINNLDMVILPNDGATEITRGAMNGWSMDFRKSIKLEITYTLL
jgi:hypothetical protein